MANGEGKRQSGGGGLRGVLLERFCGVGKKLRTPGGVKHCPTISLFEALEEGGFISWGTQVVALGLVNSGGSSRKESPGNRREESGRQKHA